MFGKNKNAITIGLSNENYNAIKTMARKEKKSMGYIINYIISSYFNAPLSASQALCELAQLKKDLNECLGVING